MSSASENLTDGKAASEEKALSAPPRPKALTPIFENIPAVLRDMVRWVVWRYDWAQKKSRPGRWAKVPYNVRTGRKARSNDPRDCHSFDEARAAYEAGGYDGVGMVHLHSDNVTGLDGDHCRDPHTGAIREDVSRHLAVLDSYTEISPSGTGVRGFAFGKKPGRRCSGRGKPLEIYDGLTANGDQGGRFLTVTGHRLNCAPETVNARQEQIDQIYQELFVETPADEFQAYDSDEGQADHVTDGLVSAAGQASRAETGANTQENPSARAEFERRVHLCRTAKHPNRSDADFSVCCFAIEHGIPADYVFSRIKDSDKIAERGRAYFDGTWKNAAERVRNQMNGHTPKTPAWDISRPSPAAQADAGQTPPGGPQADDDIDQIHLTDTGNGKRLVRDHGTIIRFCHPWGKWLIWDGRRWGVDNTGGIMALAKRTILALYRWAENTIKALPADDNQETKKTVARIKAVLDFTIKSLHVSRLKGMLELAKSEPGIPILPEQLDSHIWLFNCPNGTLDLRTGKLRAHEPRDYLTKLCPTNYVESAPCPIWKSTVNSIFANEANLIECVRRFLGYSLTGDTREQELPIANGKGANGKTLFLRTGLNVMGSDYASIVPSELLLKTKGDQHPTIKATLFGKRLMIAFETGEDAQLNEARLKTLTGEDGVSARRMKEDFWDFTATHKIILCTNHLPRIRGQDHGIWRRLAIWPFIQTYWDSDKGETGPPHLKADKTLKDQLIAEYEGILAWLVQGCLDWQQHGIILPDAVRSATSEYKSTEDKIAQFLAENCDVSPYNPLQKKPRVKVSILWGAFQAWAKKANEHPGTSTAFGLEMSDRGFAKDDGKRWYLGLDLRNPDANDEGGPQS